MGAPKGTEAGAERPPWLGPERRRGALCQVLLGHGGPLAGAGGHFVREMSVFAMEWCVPCVHWDPKLANFRI